MGKSSLKRASNMKALEYRRHPTDPQSNVAKFGSYDPNKYVLDLVSASVRTDECLLPGRPPCLTQRSVAKCIQPITRELVECPPCPTINELPQPVIDSMVRKDKAYWVDKPGSNDYNLHDIFNKCGMTTEIVKPTHQDVFPRSHQYDLDCVKYRRSRVCEGLHQKDPKKPLGAQCRDCNHLEIPGLTPFQLAWAQEGVQKRWRYYPDLSATLSPEEINKSMAGVGRPFQNEACNWYNKNYPTKKFNCILRKFSK